MPVVRTLGLLLVAVAVLLPGCVLPGLNGGKVEVRGESVRVSDGWSYDGSKVRLADGSAGLSVRDGSNTGSVTMQVTEGLSTYRLEWTTFAGARPFHDGGIVRNLREHGDTGVGDTSIPAVNLSAAGWGSARLYRNGQLLRDPGTGAETLAAHFMVVQGTLRDDEGRILARDRTTPYDPADPGNAYVAADGRDLFIQLTSADRRAIFLVFEFRDVHGA